ncbi:hypothetical protein BDM02DRAFT_3096672 [Thelephora ganbajun]|uniref:Uncharacterized protein n=1 Tax=Thelephora ganbajun TaxID=370292 RepID=A0ACB6ZFF5_THEGA|nr:hypothetical protein BDM02DRAFT_3096672 [Thelephora ganbajun]
MADSYTAAPARTSRRSAPPANRSQVSSNSDVLLYFLAIFIPPLPVSRKDFCINILLWILGWIPGVIHSW